MEHRHFVNESKRSRRTHRGKHGPSHREGIWTKLSRVDVLLSCILLCMVSLIGIILSLLDLPIAWFGLIESGYLMTISYIGVYAIHMRSKDATFLFALLSVINAGVLCAVLILDASDVIDIRRYYANLNLLFLHLIPSGERPLDDNSQRALKAQTAAQVFLWYLDYSSAALGLMAYYIGLKQSQEQESIFTRRDSSRRIVDNHLPPPPPHRATNPIPYQGSSAYRHPPANLQPSPFPGNVYPIQREHNSGFSPVIDNQHQSWIQGRRQLRATDDNGPSNFGRYDSSDSSASGSEPIPPPKSSHYPRLHIVNVNRNPDANFKALEPKSKVGISEKEFPLHPGY